MLRPAQVFGTKSEKRLEIDPAGQGHLFAALSLAAPPTEVPPAETISYRRRKKMRDAAVNETGLRFISEAMSDQFSRQIKSRIGKGIRANPDSPGCHFIALGLAAKSLDRIRSFVPTSGIVEGFLLAQYRIALPNQGQDHTRS
jgi:hypothetical protein